MTGKGGTIRLAVRRAGREITFDVSDTGPGIDPEDQHTCLTGAPRTRPTQAPGSGSGSRAAIVEAHGGAIAVRSTPGEGATFTFTLPAVAS